MPLFVSLFYVIGLVPIILRGFGAATASFSVTFLLSSTPTPTRIRALM
jgi:hypothetical protein